MAVECRWHRRSCRYFRFTHRHRHPFQHRPAATRRPFPASRPCRPSMWSYRRGHLWLVAGAGDVSAAERGGAGETVSSDETGGSRLRSPAPSGGHAGRDGSRASKWRLSGRPLVMPPSSSVENGTSARWPPDSDAKLIQDVNRVTSTVEVSDGTSTTAVGNASRDVVDVSQLKEVAKRGRLFAKRCKKRLVYQSGECNLSYINVERRGARFLLDIFTTLLEMKWRFVILFMVVLRFCTHFSHLFQGDRAIVRNARLVNIFLVIHLALLSEVPETPPTYIHPSRRLRLVVDIPSAPSIKATTSSHISRTIAIVIYLLWLGYS